MENGSGQAEGKDPSAFLTEIIGSAVVVKLNSGVVYKGELQSVDGYMNIALEKTEEFVNGVKRRTYGDAFVRGNNGESTRGRGDMNEANALLCTYAYMLISFTVMYISADA
jgi:U6 snRNA-associated Sm-like protein LSm6